MKIELIDNIHSVKFEINIYERTCCIGDNIKVLDEEIFHPLINIKTLTSSISIDLRREIEDKFNQEFSEFMRVLSTVYLSSYIIVKYLADAQQLYFRSALISLEEIHDTNVKFRIEYSYNNSRVNYKERHVNERYAWLAGIEITDGCYHRGKWIFGSTRPELISYVLSHFRLGKIILTRSCGLNKIELMVNVNWRNELGVQLLKRCKKLLEELTGDGSIMAVRDNNIININFVNNVRSLVHEQLRPLLEKYLPTKLDQALILTAILAGDGVKHNRGLRISYSLLRRTENAEHTLYAKGFVIDSILTYLRENNIVKLNRYLLRIRGSKHEGQVCIDLNPEIAPLIPLFVPYGRGLSYMSLLSSVDCTWSTRTMYDLVHDVDVLTKLREIANIIDYGYIAYKGCRGHYYLVLKARRDFVNRIVECLRGLGFNPQVYRSRPNEIRVYRGKEVLAKLLLECGKLRNVDEYRGVLEEWFRRLG